MVGYLRRSQEYLPPDIRCWRGKCVGGDNVSFLFRYITAECSFLSRYIAKSGGAVHALRSDSGISVVIARNCIFDQTSATQVRMIIFAAMTNFSLCHIVPTTAYCHADVCTA